jgi:hypothetical protein
MKEKSYLLTIILTFAFLPFILNGQDSYRDVVSLDNSSQAMISKKDKDEKKPGKGFSLGLKGGMDFSTWSDFEVTDPMEIVYQKGFQGGLVGEIGFSKNFALQFEFLYAQKGLRVEVPQIDDFDQPYTAKSWFNVNYLDIPLVFKVSFPIGPVSIYGDVGPYAGIGLSAKTTLDPDIYGTQSKDIGFQKNGFKRFDFGFVFGAGIGYELWKGDLFLDFRYDYGLTDINNVEDEIKALPEYKKYCNRNIGLAIGYIIRLGK